MKKIVYSFFAVSLLLSACKKDDDRNGGMLKDNISGASQKGPFLNGSSVTVYDLLPNLTQTGQVFNTRIADNTGSFQLSSMNLSSQYVRLRADGFYFNEVTNVNSSAPITLYSVSDVLSRNTVNVNLLSTLEVSRIEYLVSRGATFASAKDQAQREVLAIFFWTQGAMSVSEELDISQSGDGNAKLLAASVILQGFRSEAELSQLLGDISTDLRLDGVLNSSSLGSELAGDAALLDLSKIRMNLEQKYANFGVTAAVPNFESYVAYFLQHHTYGQGAGITYPQTGRYGVNMINRDTITANEWFSFTANVPAGRSVKVVYNILQDSGLASEVGSEDGWLRRVSPGLDQVTYESSRSGIIDMHATSVLNTNRYPNGAAFTLDFYENNSATPTFSKTIFIKPQ